ncbi:hypothetical protein V2J09_020612 [Rumex salicifolius]
MAESAAKSAINLLGKILVEEGKYLWGVEENIEDVRDELLWMQSFLKEADTIQFKDDTVRMWVSQIKDHAYEAEDIIEDFVINVASRRQKTGFLNKLRRYSCFLSELYDLHCAASSIDSLKVKISTLSPKLEKYGIKRSLGIHTGKAQEALIEHVQQSLRYAHIEKKKTIGLEKDAQEIIAALKSKTPNRGYHAIYGMGGLGKTTLATKIFDNDEVKQYFSGGQAFTYISKQFQEESVIRDILQSLKIEEIEKLSKSGLVSKLQETLKNKKCLVVLDDVWTLEAWDSLKSSCGEVSGSKVLLTTRKEEVAKYVDPMALLSEKIKLGMEMMKVCKGLPLSIVVLGGILRKKRTLGEWRSVHNNINLYLKRGYDHGRSCMDIVLQSYNDLAYHLKACFLHLANFPEDIKIYTYLLYYMWVAEGLVTRSDDTKRPEDVVNEYLTELAQDGLVEIVDKDEGWIKSIRMHDLVRDVCCEKATSENLIEIIDLRTCPDIPAPANYSRKRLLRMVIYFAKESKNQVPPSSKAHKYIRSLFLIAPLHYSKNYKKLNAYAEWIKFICEEFQVLRVLVLCRSIFYMLPSQVENLTHLRYLSLGESFVVELPSSIGNLSFLEILDLRVCNRCNDDRDEVLKIPNTLWKLFRLRHLLLPGWGYEIKKSGKMRVDTLICLEELHGLLVGNLEVEGLQKLGSLRILTIDDEVGDEAVLDMIRKGPAGSLRGCYLIVKGLVISKHPSILSDMGVCELDLKINGRLTAGVMEKVEFCRYLEAIELEGCEIEDDPMTILGSLSNLESLKLNKGSYVGQKLSCHSRSFPRLTSLAMMGLENLEVLVVEDGSMPNLERLSIVGCHKLNRFPDVLPASLKRFQVRYNGQDFAPITRDTNAGLKWNMLSHYSSHPLSKVMLAGLLILKEDITEWENKHKELTGSTPLHFSQIFSICYADLPLHLRSCLIYLANFPKDTEISAKKLYQMWIAAGFVRSPKHPGFVRSKHDAHDVQTNGDLESLANSYLTELEQRSMVTVWKSKHTKRAKTCQLKSALRCLCLKKAKEEHSLMIVDQPVLSTLASNAKLTTQQLAVHLDQMSLTSLYEQLCSLNLITSPTSLVVFPKKSGRVRNEEKWDLLLYICRNFQQLRVLDVEGMRMTKGRLPKEVGHLGQLRYLSLRGTWVTELPSSIENLRELQTLDLRVMESMIIPDVLWKLKCLMHLYLPDEIDQETPKLLLLGLICLQTLANLHTDKVHLKHLCELKLLRKISIKKIHAMDDELHEIVRSVDLEVSVDSEIINANPTILSSFQHLRKLRIKGRLSVQLYVEMFPTHLEELTLKHSRLVEDPLPILEKLSKLKSLFFLQDSFLGETMRMVSKEFYERATLTLCSLTNLKELYLPICSGESTYNRIVIIDCSLEIVKSGLSAISSSSEVEEVLSCSKRRPSSHLKKALRSV